MLIKRYNYGMKIYDIKIILNQAGYTTESEVSMEDSFCIGGINEKDIFITREGQTIKTTFNLDKKENALAVGIMHTMPYGAYLEFGFNRKYSVLQPVMRAYAPKLLEKVRQIMGGK